ncbi:hypothetical protein QN277_018706 [Acacia crassicarpa]|uniref:Uncharacterized protein n=1 Tax=Acacia crassicarpa TaxID=499986 RepID=A0AAE1IRJ4_9FABA|nr:hypothetical protein QN277_009616 [Acacia crassicarpa]KAK4275666.1 hypothetical protein QN277_018706 [Acacia crassicarpa]
MKRLSKHRPSNCILQQELERTRQQANEALKAMDGDRQQLRSANNNLQSCQWRHCCCRYGAYYLMCRLGRILGIQMWS